MQLFLIIFNLQEYNMYNKKVTKTININNNLSMSLIFLILNKILIYLYSERIIYNMILTIKYIPKII